MWPDVPFARSPPPPPVAVGGSPPHQAMAWSLISHRQTCHRERRFRASHFVTPLPSSVPKAGKGLSDSALPPMRRAAELTGVNRRRSLADKRPAGHLPSQTTGLSGRIPGGRASRLSAEPVCSLSQYLRRTLIQFVPFTRAAGRGGLDMPNPMCVCVCTATAMRAAQCHAGGIPASGPLTLSSGVKRGVLYASSGGEWRGLFSTLDSRK